MRTKTLLATAALTAAGIASSMAQVFSVNAVGYINLDVAPGFSIIANQLNNNGKNTLADLLPAPPEDTTIYKFNGTGYDVSTFSFGAWDAPTLTLNPGEAAFIRNTTAAAFKVTFVGEVPTGNLANPLPAGFSIRSSQVPQAGKLATDLKFPTDGEVSIFQFNVGTKSYDTSSYDPGFAEWSPSEPTVKVGEGFFVRRTAAGSWTRTFNVNS